MPEILEEMLGLTFQERLRMNSPFLVKCDKC